MSKLELRLLTDEHVSAVESLLLNSFFLHEPLNERFGYNLPIEVEDFINAVIKYGINDQCSFVFVDGNKIPGMIINTIKHKNDEDNAKEFQSKSLRYIYKMLGGLQETRNVFDYFNVDRILYTGVVSVDSNYRGQRLSEKLIEKSLDYAKEHFHLEAAYTETTSHYSLKAFLKLNYQILNEIIYEIYDKENLSNMGIHDRCTLVGRKL